MPSLHGGDDHVPNLGGNTFFLFIFLVALLAQIALAVRYRTWTFLIGMIIGLVLKILGYAGRTILHKNLFIMNKFLLWVGRMLFLSTRRLLNRSDWTRCIQNLCYLICLTISPALLTGSIYLRLSRIITVCGAQHSRLAPRPYIIIFIGCDVIALILQAVERAMASTAKDRQGSLLGTHVMVAGLSWQVPSLALFIWLWSDDLRRFKKARSAGASALDRHSRFGGLKDSKKFRDYQIALTVATVMILIRSIYRVAEPEQ